MIFTWLYETHFGPPDFRMGRFVEGTVQWEGMARLDVNLKIRYIQRDLREMWSNSVEKKNELNEQANENTVESDGFIESLAVEGGDGAGVGAAERRRDAADVGRVIGDRIRCKADDL